MWNIDFYETVSGASPVLDFVEDLEIDVKSKVVDTLDLLKKHGVQIGLPHSKKIKGTDLWELRILGYQNVRIFYIAIIKKTFLLLHGFKKKSWKIPKKEIKTATKRWIEYNSRN